MKKAKAKRNWVMAAIVALLAALGIALAITLSQPKDAADQISAKLRLPVEITADPARVDYARLNERIGLVMQEPNSVGLAVAAIERGRLRFIRGYGETLANSGQRVTPDTVFRWASVSKGVAAALVTRLADQGRLSLDMPLSKMGTTLTLPGGTDKASVADLLSHRLGLVRNAWDDRLEAGADPKVIRGELGTLPPFCPPGTCYAYQNIAYDAASEIVAQATGEDYATAARTRLFEPLGMKNASVGRAGLEHAKRWARPHRLGRHAVSVNDDYYRIPAAGGVNSSVRDLARWMLAQMGAAPSVLPAATLATMHEPRVATPPHGRRGAMDRALTDASYGLGWRTYHYAGHNLVGHRGSVDGYGSLILFDPVDRSGIAMLWNSNRHVPARLQLEFFDMLYGLPPTDWLELPPAGVRIEAAR